MSNTANSDARKADCETLDRRYSIAVNLESWELLAMHSIASDESISRVRLRLMKAFVGLPPGDGSPNDGAASPRGGGGGSGGGLGSIRRS